MNNNRKTLLYLSISVITFVVMLTHYSLTRITVSNTSIDKIEKTLRFKEKLAFDFLEKIKLKDLPADFLHHSEDIAKLNKCKIEILFSKSDSLIFWTAPIPISMDSLSLQHEESKFLERNGKLYESIKKAISSEISCWVIIEVIANHTPNNMLIHENSSGFVKKLYDFTGKSSVLIDTSEIINQKSGAWLRFFLFIISCISGLMAIQLLAARFWVKLPEWMVSTFILSWVFGLRFAYTFFHISRFFDDLDIFKNTLNSAYLGASIGDFLLNVLVFLWIVIYWFNTFKATSYEHLSTKIRWLLGISIYFAISLGIIMISGIIKSTILESNIYFDFENVFNLDWSSFVLIFGLMIVFITLFLYSQRLMFTINLLKLTSLQRIMAIPVSILLCFGFLYFVPIVGINLKFFLFILMYLLLLDFYSDASTTDFTWLMIWLIIFSSFSAALLFSYNQQKEELQLKQYAKLLANPHDKVLENKIKQISESTQSYLESNSSIVSSPYFSKFYKITDNLDSNEVLLWYKLKDIPLKWGLSIHNGNVVYRYEIQGKQTFLITKNYTESNLHSGISEIESLSYKGLSNLNRYGYALYYKQTLVFQNANFQSNQFDNIISSYKNIINQKFKALGSKNEDPSGREVEINKIGGGLIKLLSLFSYLFVLLAITFLFLIAMNTFFKFIPGIYFFEKQSDISLRTKVQIAIIAMIVLSFVAIGIITVTYFNYSNKRNLSNNLIRKVANMSQGLAQNEKQNTDNTNLEKISTELESEILIYNTNGILQKAFPQGIEKVNPTLHFLSMHPIILTNFNENSYQNSNFQSEDKSYLVHAYTGKASKILGYVSLPLSKTDLTTNSQIADFIGALINTYVFLLLLASALALAIGRSITKPLFALGDKLNRLKLGKQNEPLSWTKNDEIGFLVREYNQMIVKLEQSAQLLAKSEREDAWKEMARQVAHEIKNPLTPMKLNVQYLLHSYKSEPETIETRIKSICQVLIQQIDNLSAIAETFGEFAQEPKPTIEIIPINEMTDTIFQLFEKTGNEYLSFEKDICTEKLYVSADKSHLIRVVNNLIKNAIQSIHKETPGKILIKLYRNKEDVVLEVVDNGCGIEDSQKTKIFIPNFTTKSSGSGLGLSICKKLVESMGGDIYFESYLNKGTSFFVRLPIEANE